MNNKKEDINKKIEKVSEKVDEVARDAMHEVEDMATKRTKELVKMARHFFHLESSGGLVLVLAALAALIIANTDLYYLYDYILHKVYFEVGFSDEVGFAMQLKKPLLLWINDGLMAVFFFLIGLEIKREFVEGDLSSPDRLLLPALMAIGGMIVPAGIFWYLNQGMPENIQGWAIPVATDIAFALGVLSLLGKRVPIRLKTLLTAVAVIDDILAILIIAVFYSHEIYMIPLYIAAAIILVLFVLNKQEVTSILAYVLCFAALWIAVVESGIHATLAGVVAALFVPVKSYRRPGYSPCKEMEHILHPWVAFGVLPVFGFANAGVPFAGMGWGDLFAPLTLGIAAGLFVGKQLGVFGLMWLALVTRMSPMPYGTNWRQLYAVCVLCGIGFTMSLFIGSLAFADTIDMQAPVRLGILLGSLISAVTGYLILYSCTTCPVEQEAEEGNKSVSS